MAVTSRHNKYTSIPDWFSGQSTETATTSPISQTVYIGGSSSATIAGSTVDFKDIPIDDSTIVWLNEQLTVPIDNDKIIIVDGKVTTSANASGVWELRQLTDGTNYIYTTYPVVTQLGITMYSGTEGLDIGGIYDGLPIDNNTIYWDIDSDGNRVLKAAGSSGGGVADSVAWANVVGKPTWLLDNKISYSEIEGTPDLSKYALVSQIPSLEGYALSSDLAKYIPISGYTDITGEKNFTGGLKVNGSPIYYDTEKKYWKLEGDLLVTGGVTMYGNDSDFVASTITNAILYDDSTLGINADGELYVKGGTGGGGISSVTSQMIVDALGYTPASATALSGYLPLSGGTITNSSAVPLTINANNDGQVGLFLQSKGNNKTYVGWDSSRGTCLYEFASDSSLNILNGVPRFNTNKLWHSGNDGSGSGLDADLLDGYDSSYIMKYGGNWTASTDTAGIFAFGFGGSSAGLANNYGAGIQLCNAQGVNVKPSLSNNNANWYSQLLFGTDNRVYARFNTNGSGWSGQNKIAYVTDNVASATKSTYSRYIGNVGRDGTTWYDSEYPIYFQWGGADGNSLYIKCGNYPIISTAATRLETARTIWGQSFNGTGNVDGDLTANGSITMRTGTAFDASKYLTLTNNASKYGRIGIHFNGSTQDRNDNWGDGGRSIITFRRKYDTATSYAFSYAIQHNLVDNTLGILYGSNVGILLNGAGNVGIGTTNPESYKLYVNGSIYSIGSYRSAAMIHATGALRSDTGLELYQATPYIDFHFNSSTADYTTRIIESSSGVLSLIGSLIVTGGITMYSDQRKKTILNHVELSLQQIANAPLIEHYYNSDQNKTTHVGSIAQYWAEMNDWFCKLDNEGFYTMEIQNAALASAISVARELVKFETETDRRIRLLEEENKRLKEEVEQLKWNIA